MAAAATLVLKNAAHVNTNYYPVKISTGEYAGYVDRTQGVLALQPFASLKYSESATQRKVSGKCTYPVKDAVTGVIDTAYGEFSFVLPKVHVLADRQEVRERITALILDAITVAAVDNGETPW